MGYTCLSDNVDTINSIVCTTVVLYFNIFSPAVCFGQYVWPSSVSFCKIKGWKPTSNSAYCKRNIWIPGFFHGAEVVLHIKSFVSLKVSLWIFSLLWFAILNLSRNGISFNYLSISLCTSSRFPLYIHDHVVISWCECIL